MLVLGCVSLGDGRGLILVCDLVICGLRREGESQLPLSHRSQTHLVEP
jgi:hypothetical protein